MICRFHHVLALTECKDMEKMIYREILKIENKASLPAHIIIECAVHVCRSAVRYHQVAKELIHIKVLMQCVVDCTK